MLLDALDIDDVGGGLVDLHKRRTAHVDFQTRRTLTVRAMRCRDNVPIGDQRSSTSL